jgi:hypothetical protein
MTSTGHCHSSWHPLVIVYGTQLNCALICDLIKFGKYLTHQWHHFMYTSHPSSSLHLYKYFHGTAKNVEIIHVQCTCTCRYEILHTLNLGCSFITLREPYNNKRPRCDIAWLHVTNDLYHDQKKKVHLCYNDAYSICKANIYILQSTTLGFRN